MKPFALVAVIAGLAGAGSAWAHPASPDQVRMRLATPDAAPRPSSDWRKLGDDVDVRLIEAATDERLDPAARARAVEALGQISTERARHFLRNLLNTSGSGPDLVAAAVHALSDLLARTDPSEALTLDKKYLDHRDWMVREAAARALGKLGTPDAEEALRARWNREKSGVVKLALSAALIDSHRRRP